MLQLHKVEENFEAAVKQALVTGRFAGSARFPDAFDREFKTDGSRHRKEPLLRLSRPGIVRTLYACSKGDLDERR